MISLNADEVSAVISLMYQDKKNESGKILGSLLDAIGSCKYDVSLTEQEIGESLFHLSLLAKPMN
jgi:3-dehydroquinate synthase